MIAVAKPLDVSHVVAGRHDRGPGSLLLLNDVHQQPPVDRLEALDRLI
jgi:hypothetical protein